MLVLIHSPSPVSVGVITSGWGRPACSPVPTSGTTGRLNATVIVFSVLTWSAPSAGWVFVTSSMPVVVNLKAMGRWSGKPAELVALSASVTWYSALRFSGSAGEKVSALPCTLTSPFTLGSMANAARVVAGSIGWSKVTTTGAARAASSPRSGVTLTTVGGSGARVGVGSGAAVGGTGWLVGGTAGLLAGACAGAVTGEDEGVGDGLAEQALRMTRTSTANKFRK